MNAALPRRYAGRAGTGADGFSDVDRPPLGHRLAGAVQGGVRHLELAAAVSPASEVGSPALPFQLQNTCLPISVI